MSVTDVARNEPSESVQGPVAPAKSPHVVMVLPRGEAVRNFVYSDTLRILSERARVTLLSVVDDEAFISRFCGLTENIISLKEHPESSFVGSLRTLVHDAHFRWLWSAVARNRWERHDRRAAEQRKRLQRALWKTTVRAFANRPSLRALTRLEQYLAWRLRRTREFDRLFEEIRPDLVFNGSHIHGLAAELPLLVGKRMGIPTAGFIFSWDNLTSRSRIFVPYDYYLVWYEPMRTQLLDIYPTIRRENVFVTGTPQFDFHFKPEFCLSREELCKEIGIDPRRPFILYTTGIDNHFPEEYRHVQSVIQHLRDIDISPKPQLVVRNYVKGTSPELKAMAKEPPEDVVFPRVLWNPKWATPLYEDLTIYTSLVRHAALSINAASTVSLEFLMLDKPVINLDFDPPGSNLPACLGYSRHINFDHFRPVAESGATMVARSEDDMRRMLVRGLTQPNADRAARKTFVKNMFGDVLDGRSGERVAERLVQLAAAH